MAKNLTELLSTLKIHSQTEDHEQVLKCAEEILALVPGDASALHSMIVALIKLDRYDICYRKFEKVPDLKTKYVKEYAYVLYQLQRVDELQKLASDDVTVQHALAQALYKTDRFDGSAELYKHLLAEDSPESQDIEVNLAAITAGKILSGDKGIAVDRPTSSSSFDLLFNAATAVLGKGEYEKALKYLQEAKLSAESSDLSPEDAAQEVAPILVQAAYVNQLQGNKEQALSILKNVESEKSADSLVQRIIENNSISMEANIHEENPHKLLARLGENQPSREISLQSNLFKLNEILLKSIAGLDACKAAKKLGGAAKTAGLVTAYIGKLDVEDKRDITSKIFKKRFSSELKTGDNISLALILAQLYYREGKLDIAVDTLASTIKKISNVPTGVVGVLFNLYKAQDKEGKAIQLLSDWLKTAEQDDEAGYIASLLASFRPEEAHEYFEKSIGKNAFNLTDIAGLIGTSKSTTESSNLYSKHLKDLVPLDVLIANKDGKTYIDLGIEPLLKKRRISEGDSKHGEKLKKRRKGKLPKNYDANVAPDPERWLPKRDRSTWKPKKKDKKGSGNMTQGGSVDNLTESVQSSQASAQKVVKAKNNPAKKKKKGKK